MRLGICPIGVRRRAGNSQVNRNWWISASVGIAASSIHRDTVARISFRSLQLFLTKAISSKAAASFDEVGRGRHWTSFSLENRPSYETCRFHNMLMPLAEKFDTSHETTREILCDRPPSAWFYFSKIKKLHSPQWAVDFFFSTRQTVIVVEVRKLGKKVLFFKIFQNDFNFIFDHF